MKGGGKARTNFGQSELVQDWIMLLETYLQFGAWLSRPEMYVESVQRLKIKMKEMMMMTKQIGRRSKGMGLRTFNFHAGLHIADDILDFGVPRVVDTSSNEMNHKPDKKCAKRTQRRPRSFEYQCANRIHEMALIDLAMHDLEGRPVYDYLSGYAESDENG
jgi:hypothetical protein